MSDGSLSQDEIDALLQGSDDFSSDGGGGGASDFMGGGSMGGGSEALSSQEIAAFKDMLVQSSEKQGKALEAMINTGVTLSNPRIEVTNLAGVTSQLPQEIVEVQMDFDSGISGPHSYILQMGSSSVIAGLMMGQDGGEITEASLSAIGEAMNVLVGNACTTIGTIVKKELRTSPPEFSKKSKDAISFGSNEIVKVVYDFTIEGNPASTLVELFDINSIKELVSQVVPSANQPNMSGGQPNMGMMGGQPNMGMPNMGMMGGQPNMGMPNMGMMGGQPNMGMPNMGMMGGQQMGMMQSGGYVPPNAQVQHIQFQPFADNSGDNQPSNINLLMDVAMELTVELGRTRKSVKYILGMGEGTVLELDKLAGEPVDILVNGKLIARGEVVVIDENFGVRVTEIISPMDRIQEL